MTHDRYKEVFGKLPIIGMIHLGGSVGEALNEIKIFEEEGVDGVIVENYYGSLDAVESVLNKVQGKRPALSVGVNVLPNEFEKAFSLAGEYADFIQVDHVAGRYEDRFGNTYEIDSEKYNDLKEKHKNILVLGGVWPKYYSPVGGSVLENDLKIGVERADVIVVTGEGTGKETPFEKIMEFKERVGDHPLFVGAGMTVENAYGQLLIADGAIVGTYFKRGGRTENSVDPERVRDFVSIVRSVRAYRAYTGK